MKIYSLPSLPLSLTCAFEWNCYIFFPIHCNKLTSICIFQFVIDNQVLPCLYQLLTQNHKKSIKKEACWTISNITAGNKGQIQVQNSLHIWCGMKILWCVQLYKWGPIKSTLIILLHDSVGQLSFAQKLITVWCS